jgi:sulfate transport system permease protein
MATRRAPEAASHHTALTEPALVRAIVTALALLFVATILIAPVITIIGEALRDGVRAYFAAILDEETLFALRLTLITAAICLPLSVSFGVAAAWLLTRYDIRGRSLFLAVIDAPLAVSPVLSGMMFVLLFGAQGWLGPWLERHSIRIIFATPGIVLATAFVSTAYVARELIPLMQDQGVDEELAALSLGARPWQMFWRVSFPKFRWALLHGALLANARAIGEFGAVSVVSGHIRGFTDTAPLHIEILYNEYKFSAAFAVATVLGGIAVLTLIGKNLVERRLERSP